MKRHILIYPLLLICGILYAQQTILLSEGRTVDGIHETIPTRDVEETDNGITVTYELNAVNIQKDPLFKGASYVKIEGFGYNSVPSEPCTLFRWDSFVVPKNVDVAVSIIDSTFVDVPMELAPARPPLYDTEEKGFEWHTKEIASYDGLFPLNIISETRQMTYQGIPVLKVCYNPIKYDYNKKEVRIYTKVSYHLEYVHHSKGEKDVNPVTSEIDSFLANTTLNGAIHLKEGKTLANTKFSVNTVAPKYYIVTVPAYSEAANRFAVWKRTLGFDVSVLIDSNWTTSKLKNQVQPLVNNQNYLLIIGDHGDVPADYVNWNTGGSNFSFYTDFYYSNDDEFEIPAVFSGRLSASTVAQANTVVDKVINYERYPISDPNFYNTILCCAHFQDTTYITSNNIQYIKDDYEDLRFVLTAEEIRNYMLSKGKTVNRVYTKSVGSTPLYWNDDQFAFGDPIPDSLHIGNFNWNGTTTDIINRFNQGANIVVYNGHGTILGWSNPSLLAFPNENASPWPHNGSKLPVVLSISCQTGNFVDMNECFAEKMQRCNDGGGIAVVAATRNSPIGANDGFVEGIFDTLWPNPGIIPVFPYKTISPYYAHTQEYRIGKVLAQGMEKMSQTWIYDDYLYMYYELFGDPSMFINTEIPTAFTGVNISRTSNIIAVDMDYDPNAIITFYNTEHSGVEIYQGVTHAECSLDIEHVVVSISGPNKIPLIDPPCDNYYIQNETITGPCTIECDTIKIGHHVTNLRPQGNVVFDGGTIILKGKNITLDAGTTIEEGTIFETKNN